MHYYHLKSILASAKQRIPLHNESDSFHIVGGEGTPYIEPTFEKVEFDKEKPTVILVSAVGATGKTTLARHLSRDLQMPLLDLSKHKPVGDNTMTGLLTRAFAVGDISSVFSGLASGSYGIIVDGVDEGRSKTTEKGFEAFLDDIANLCGESAPSTFLLLGRTQIVDDCWLYLVEKNVSTALVTILPFTLAEAATYIDTFSGVEESRHSGQYREARDMILQRLGGAFSGSTRSESGEFLSFIGYPPVLDAIVTLLTEERNFHKLVGKLGPDGGTKIEVGLLDRIAEYILHRERQEKIIPNILNPILDEAPKSTQERAGELAFSPQEQCIRLVAYCLGRHLALGRLGERVLDEKYEERLESFLGEHPFLKGREFRNAVFEAVALGTLICSREASYLQLVKEYMSSRRPSYHLVLMLDLLAKDRFLPLDALNTVLTSAMEFSSYRSLVELRVEGADWRGELLDEESAGEIEIGIEILLGRGKENTQDFEFRSEAFGNSRLDLGPRVASTFISVPCHIRLSGGEEVELVAPVELSGKSVEIEGKRLILRDQAQRSSENGAEVVITAGRVGSRVETITTNGVPLSIASEEMAGLSYPIVQYVKEVASLPQDPLLREKYFRLRRILMAFRSHGRGSLARYRFKIEHERVLKNRFGERLLKKLTTDRILELRGNMYHMDPDELGRRLGITWQDLRLGKVPGSTAEYLRSID